jgi:hypothetical protein
MIAPPVRMKIFNNFECSNHAVNYRGNLILCCNTSLYWPCVSGAEGLGGICIFSASNRYCCLDRVAGHCVLFCCIVILKSCTMFSVSLFSYSRNLYLYRKATEMRSRNEKLSGILVGSWVGAIRFLA